ncbi:aminofutalosine synthase MqnE [Candidatus Oleimmundimicrobium sp.]|uniref:aminofutalosine synthase MqnE n=1 Tax=Candidatus Oleimmundimicrobium sp. TaxID=3060597 RepID=UPI002722D2A3|nr:aminofutalosine synthase MqnE [Candidatus Oleimmundimicrobium sp.]MDO8885909.1 aminofutalosine synthase MqnE [Candidatus Oleimmundimicrobium sp.]
MKVATKKFNLADIQEKILNNKRLTREDGINLINRDDILFLGRLAKYVKERKTNNRAYFNVNQHINLTNICVSRCKFCAFSCNKSDPSAYTMSIEEVINAALRAPKDITELHIVSGLHPDKPFDYYVNVIKALKKEFPNIHVKAFTAVEIDYFSKISGLSVEEIFKILKEAGVNSLPGGGAEIFNPIIRKQICPKKATANEWLNVVRAAHKLGLKSNATMLYGHIETLEDRVDHLIKIRELQDETAGFLAFIPLPFHPQNTELSHLKKPTAVENLKMIAISRLMLDNFDHIKAYWIMMGPKVAQLSLDFGADDIDGTVTEEKITHAAGAQTDKFIEKNELIEMIKEMGRVPVERDTLYNIVKMYE